MRAQQACPRAAQVAAGSVLLGVAIGALAQRDEEGVTKLDRVEVTGTRITRVEGESGLPVQVITRDEMQQGGMQTMQDLLERISANQSFGSWNETKGVGSTLVGFTSASLRGLGSQRTLVLLNGRRIAPYALSGGQSVDLSGIPASALEKVEILKDGASAVYGTDAIGGVINFILRKDYQGVELNGSYFGTTQGGGDNWRVSGTGGFGDLAQDKYNFFVSADYFKQDALKAAQREVTRTSYLPGLGLDLTSPASYPSNISQTDPLNDFMVYGFPGFRNPTIPVPGGPTPESCRPPYSFPTVARPNLCMFDYASVIDSIPASEKANVIARFTARIDASNQFFAEGSYYQGRFTQRFSPTPVNSFTAGSPMTLPPSSPYYPAAYVAGQPGGDPAAPLELIYRTVELGARTNEATAEQWTAVAGLQGVVKGWDYALAGNYTSNRQQDHYQSGYVYTSKFGEVLRSGIVNPFGPNTDAALNLMRSTQVTGQANDNRASNYGFDLKLSNNVWKLPGGDVALAFGTEARRETLEQSNADFIVSGDVLGGGGEIPSITSVGRTVWSLFGEVNVPLAKTLEANLALRYDQYSDFGGTTNPKLTLRWQPSKSLLLRGAAGTGFRAPTLSDLFLPQSETIGVDEGIQDPLRCAITNAPPDCLGFFIPVRVGGNPALQPETSQQINAGFVVEPAAGFSTGLDYYWVRVKNVIGIVPVETIFQNYAQIGSDYVVRLPPDPNHPNLPGRIDYVVQYPTNTGDLTTSGIDIDLQWHGPASSIGQFSLMLNGTYVIDYSYAGYKSGALPSGVGMRGPDGAIARYRQYAQLGWNYGPWGATLANNYQSGYNEVDLLSCNDEGECPGTRRVGAWSSWDLQARYTGVKNAIFTLGVRNLLDTPPPVSNQAGSAQVGIDATYADPRGRIIYGAIRYAFE